MGKIDTLFLDIGGVLMTNGWDHNERKKACQQFELNEEEFAKRHQEYYDQHEKGEMTLDEYLQKTVFWQTRNFTSVQFKQFMFAQSQPYPEMIQLIRAVKEKYSLKVVIISNEGRELAEYRIQLAQLKSLAEAFFISCFVHYQKPDPRIFHLALDVMQSSPSSVLYIDDRPNLIEAAAKLGIRGIVHTTVAATKQQLIF